MAQSGWQTPTATTNPLQVSVAAGAYFSGNASGATYGPLAGNNSIQIANGPCWHQPQPAAVALGDGH